MSYQGDEGPELDENGRFIRVIRLREPIIGFGRLKGKPFYAKHSKKRAFFVKLGGGQPDDYDTGKRPYLIPLPKTNTDWDAVAKSLASLQVLSQDTLNALIRFVEELIQCEDTERKFFTTYDRGISRTIAASFVVHCLYAHDVEFAYVVKKFITSFSDYPSTTAIMAHQKTLITEAEYVLQRPDARNPKIVFRVVPNQFGDKSAIEKLVEDNMEVIEEFDKENIDEGYYK